MYCYYKCSVALPHGALPHDAVGKSSECDCGICLSSSLNFGDYGSLDNTFILQRHCRTSCNIFILLRESFFFKEMCGGGVRGVAVR